KDTFYTDRQYRSNQDSRNKPYGNSSYRNRTSAPVQTRKCWVCQKDDCRSWKHPKDEQDKAKDQFRANSRYKGNNRKFEKQFKQYLTDCDDGTDALFDAFNTVTVDSDSDSDDNDPDSNQDSFFTAYGTLDRRSARDTVTELSNRSCLHALGVAPATAIPLSD